MTTHSGRAAVLMSVMMVHAWAAAPAAAQEPDRARWLTAARWGVMTHYLADGIARADRAKEPLTVDRWNALIEDFDADGLARQLEAVGAGYHVLTLGQNSGFYLAPNATYDRLVGGPPGKCARRDLVADLSEALHRRAIRLIVYLPSGAPSGDRTAVTALGWQDGPNRNREFQLRWEEVIREWSLRWGKQVDGWWFDGCYWPNTMYRTDQPPNFASFAAAARAGNPAAIVAFNPGVVDRTLSITPHEDYIAGEVNNPAQLMIRRAVAGNVDGARLHVLTYLGQTWGRGAPRYAETEVVAWVRKINRAGGAFTWDVPIGADGLIAKPFITRLATINKALEVK